MTAEQSHTELMVRLSRGDETALDALVAAFAPALLRFARRTLADPNDAEDVVQDAFVRVWQARRRWHPSASVSTYLYTIVTRLCLNRRRWLLRRPAHGPIASDDEGAHPDRATPDPERLAASSQLGRALAAELAALPPNQRNALLLRHEAGLSYREIADALDTSAAAVESLLSRARTRLRRRLAGWLAASEPAAPEGPSEGNPAARG